MRIIQTLILIFFIGRLQAQMLVVVDENNKPLPYFSLSIEGNSFVKIGDIEGKVAIEDHGRHCNYVIRYLGYKNQKICFQDLKAGENLIKLEPEFVDLPQSQVMGMSNEKLISSAKLQITEMADKFNVARAFVTEISDSYNWKSFGILTLAGLKDRSNKNNKFHSGNMGFIAQNSMLLTDSKDFLPYNSSMSVVSTFTQDLLYDILRSKNSDWKVSSEIPDAYEEILESDKLNVLLYLTHNGSIKKVRLNNQKFKHYTGESFGLSGNLNFIRDRQVCFFSAFDFQVEADNKTTKVYCVIPDIPNKVVLPDGYKNRSRRDALLNSIGAFTSSPDYSYNALEFNSLLEKIKFNREEKERSNKTLISESYQYHEQVKMNEQASLNFLNQNSKFIQELIKVFKSNELAW